MAKRRPQNRKGTGRGKEVTQFAPGHSGNPGGRPKGIMQLVRGKTRDGAELVNFALKVLRGKSIGKRLYLGTEIDVKPDTRERLEALRWLGDRGFGKALQEVDVTGGGVVGVVILPPEDE